MAPQLNEVSSKPEIVDLTKEEESANKQQGPTWSDGAETLELEAPKGRNQQQQEERPIEWSLSPSRDFRPIRVSQVETPLELMQETARRLMRFSVDLISNMYDFREKLYEFQTTDPGDGFQEILEEAEHLDTSLYDLLLGASEVLQLAHAHEDGQFKYHHYYFRCNHSRCQASYR